MDFLVVLVVLVVVVLVVSAPLRRRGTPALDVDAVREELEAERDAKYREIRDAELDQRGGKLSEADWRAVDRSLRGEAVEILRQLDALGGGDPREDEPPGGEAWAGDPRQRRPPSS